MLDSCKKKKESDPLFYASARLWDERVM